MHLARNNNHCWMMIQAQRQQKRVSDARDFGFEPPSSPRVSRSKAYGICTKPARKCGVIFRHNAPYCDTTIMNYNGYLHSAS